MLPLRLHSHSTNRHLGYIYKAFSLVKGVFPWPSLGPFTELHPRSPKTFVWRGPDPEHHFSTAVSALLPLPFPCARASQAPSPWLTPGLVYRPARRSRPRQCTTPSVPSPPGRPSSTPRSRICPSPRTSSGSTRHSRAAHRSRPFVRSTSARRRFLPPRSVAAMLAPRATRARACPPRRHVSSVFGGGCPKRDILHQVLSDFETRVLVISNVIGRTFIADQWCIKPTASVEGNREW